MLKKSPLLKFSNNALRSHLCQNAWQEGLDVFFTQNVPFSGRNGPSYAKKLVSIFIPLATPIDGPLHVIEYGAGLGFLGRQFLDHLKIQSPKLYDRTTLHLTEYSPVMIAQWERATYFKPHKDHMCFTQLDMTHFDLPVKALLSYSVYGLDSLPTRHIEVRNNQIFEVLIQTTLKKNATLINITQEPYPALTVSEIESVLTDTNSLKARRLSPQIVTQIEETFHPAPIETLPHWSKEEKQDLSAFVKSLKLTHTVQFNFIPKLKNHLQNVLKTLHPQGLHLVSDFGMASTVTETPYTHLTATYGTTQFYPVCFLHLNFLADTLKTCHSQTHRALDQTQEWAFSRHPLPSSIFEAPDSDEDPFMAPISQVLDTMETLPPFEEDYLKKCHALIQSLTPDQQCDYYLLKKASLQFFEDGHYAEAFQLAEKMVDLYEGLAIDGMMVAGWIYQQDKRYEKAEACFNAVLHHCPTFAMAYASKAVSCLAQKQNSKAKILLKNAILYSQPRDMTLFMITLNKLG